MNGSGKASPAAAASNSPVNNSLNSQSAPAADNFYHRHHIANSVIKMSEQYNANCISY